MADTTKKTHPIRGLLWGLLAGIGLALVLVFTKVIYLDLVTMIIVVVVVMVLGVLWGIFGPAKAPKGPPPAHGDKPAPPEASRFDDFETPEEEAAHLAEAGEPMETADASATGPEAAPDTAPAPPPDPPTTDEPR